MHNILPFYAISTPFISSYFPTPLPFLYSFFLIYSTVPAVYLNTDNFRFVLYTTNNEELFRSVGSITVRVENFIDDISTNLLSRYISYFILIFLPSYVGYFSLHFSTGILCQLLNPERYFHVVDIIVVFQSSHILCQNIQCMLRSHEIRVARYCSWNKNDATTE